MNDDTAVVTSEVPAESTELAELRDLAYNMSPEEFAATLPTDEIEAVGGEDCAIELASVSLVISRWVVDHAGAIPTSLDEIANDPMLADLKLWTLNDTTVDPVDGSGCNGPYPIL